MWSWFTLKASKLTCTKCTTILHISTLKCEECGEGFSPIQIDAHIYQVRNNIAHTSCALHYCSCEYCDNCQDGFISQNILRLTCIKSTIILYISSERSVELVWGIFCFPKINWSSHLPSALGITIWHIPSVMSVVNSFTYY